MNNTCTGLFSIHKHIMAISNVQFDIAKQTIKDLRMTDIIQFRRKNKLFDLCRKQI